MNRTMKIDEEVATRLAVLKRKFKRSTYSDLLESFCDFFEETRLKPTDLDSARRPPSLVITERTNRIISFIKKSEDSYLKEILKLVEKIYVSTENLDKTTIVEPQKKAVKPEQKPSDKNGTGTGISDDKLRQLNTDLQTAKSAQKEAEYKLEHQTKFVKEFLGKLKKQSMTGNWTISNEQYQHYKEELQKL